MTDRYATDDAFRTSLEQRLRDQARETGRPLDRLRKEVAHHRLLNRILESAPRGTWALKGGLALLARLDDRARATSDADANWRSTIEELEQTLDRSAALDIADGFSFEIGAPRPLEGEGAEGALRFPIRVVLAGREFERINLDVNLVPTDQRPTDEIQLRDLLGFAGIPAPVVPAIPVAQQLAEKFHAYVRSYSNGSSRPRDLYDMLVIAERLPVPPAAAVVDVCQETFAMRKTSWPPHIPEPPGSWEKAWTEFVEVYEIPWPTLAAAGTGMRAFWDPLVATEVERADWDPDRWQWNPTLAW
ncbi:MAG: nucleotidyl transferase AbiEii/AbiGii toxin family protein [Acidimicrobiia bacterium]